MKEDENYSLTEGQIDAIYKYLSISINEMTDDEKEMWHQILSKFDKDFEKFDEDDEQL